MKEEYDIDFGVHSGETQELDKAYRSFEDLYQIANVSGELTADIGRLWDETLTNCEFDDQAGSGDSRPFFDSMKNIRQVPASSFVISFLADKNDYPKVKSELGRLNAFAERFAAKYATKTEAVKRKEFKKIMTDPIPGNKSRMPDPEEILLRGLASRVRAVMGLFPELTKKTSDAEWIEYFRNMLFNFDFSYLRDIAFAFNMDSDQFNIFLNKVLRRAGTNFFNREEILTYIVLQYRVSANNADRFLLYSRLCDIYKLRENEADHPDAFKDIKSANADTQMVQNTIMDIVESLGDSVFGYSPELHDILDWVYDRSEKKVLKRSAKRVFEEELNKLLEKLAVEIKRFLVDEAENDSDNSTGQKCSPLTLKYSVKSDCVLGKGLCLKGDSNIIENGHAVPAFYETTEDVQLSADRRRELSVKVDPITESQPDDELPAMIVKEKYVEGLFRIDSTPTSSPRYEVTEKYIDTELLKIEVHPGNALRFAADGKGKEGTLAIVCAPGTVIYKGTIFSFVYRGKVYRYRVRKDEAADSASTADVPVMLLNAAELWNRKNEKKDKHENKIKVVDTGSSIYFDERPDIDGLCIFSVTNKKPVSATDPTATDKNKKKAAKANYYTLFRYLYGDEEYRGVTSYGPSYFLNTAEFNAARLSYSSVSQFPKSEVKARDLLLTLCFLNFVSEDHSSDCYAQGVSRTQGLIDDFTTRCNAVMSRCSFMTLYSGNPYDEFLRRMLTSEDPMELYQSIFSDKHPLTQYIRVNIDDMFGEWDWKVVHTRSDGTEEIWGEGQEKKGPQIITLPRLVTRNEAKYKIVVTDKAGNRTEWDIIPDASQECEINI